MAQHLAIAGLGDDRPGIVSELSAAVLDYGCSVDDSRMTVLGAKFAVIVLVSGNWNALTRLTNALPELGDKLGLTFVHQETEWREIAGQRLPYTVDVVALDQPGLVHNLTEFFAQRDINIQELGTRRYAAAHTGTPMFALHLVIEIPAATHLAGLRDEFLDLCDELNVDAAIEPLQGRYR